MVVGVWMGLLKGVSREESEVTSFSFTCCFIRVHVFVYVCVCVCMYVLRRHCAFRSLPVVFAKGGAMVFRGNTFLVSPLLRPATIEAIQSQGGVVVYSAPTSLDARSGDGRCDAPIDAAVQPDGATVSGTSGCAYGLQDLLGDDRREGAASGLPTPAAERRGAPPDFTMYFSPTTLSYLRGRRLPILYESYLFACILQQQQQRQRPELQIHSWASLSRLLAYNPFCMAGIVFTTTQLPKSIKANVIAAMVFYGAAYSPELTLSTSLVVYSCVLAPARRASSEIADPQREARTPLRKARTKRELAQEYGIPCVPPSWVQDCVKYGQLLPLTHDTSQTPQAVGRVAAGMPSSSVLSGRKEHRFSAVDGSKPRAAPLSTPTPSSSTMTPAEASLVLAKLASDLEATPSSVIAVGGTPTETH